MELRQSDDELQGKSAATGNEASKQPAQPPAPEPRRFRDKYGFVIEEEFVAASTKFAQHYAPILENRRRNFADYVTKHRPLQRNDELKGLIRRGVPAEQRRRIWPFITGADRLKESHPGYYHGVLNQHRTMESVATKQIELDIRRTFPGHPVFDSEEGVEKLKRVLVCYSWRNPEVGYCQSMNFIAAMLLIVLQMEEEESFWMLVVIIEQLLPREFYTNTMLASQVDQKVFVALIEDKLPTINRHLTLNSLSLPLISTQWFLCIYVTTLPSETTLRVWDVFFNEGSKILFRVGLALLKIHEALILKATDLGTMFNILKDIPQAAFDCDLLLDVAFHQIGSFPMKKIIKLRDKFRPGLQAEAAALERQRKAAHERALKRQQESRENPP